MPSSSFVASALRLTHTAYRPAAQEKINACGCREGRSRNASRNARKTVRSAAQSAARSTQDRVSSGRGRRAAVYNDRVKELVVRPIGVVRSPFGEKVEAPRQARVASEARGRIEIEPELESALDDLDGFDRIWVIFWFEDRKSVV